MSAPRNDNALRQQGVIKTDKAGKPDAGNHSCKYQRILDALRQPAGLNRFEAERLGDHILNTTVATLRRHGHRIASEWETVPSRFTDKGTRVRRYWADADSRARS